MNTYKAVARRRFSEAYQELMREFPAASDEEAVAEFQKHLPGVPSLRESKLYRQVLGSETYSFLIFFTRVRETRTWKLIAVGGREPSSLALLRAA